MHTEQTCVPVVPPAQSISSVNLDSSSLVVEASACEQALSSSNGTNNDSPQAKKELYS